MAPPLPVKDGERGRRRRGQAPSPRPSRGEGPGRGLRGGANIQDFMPGRAPRARMPAPRQR
ncbi:MAG: hypothetical protein E5Y32_13840 [Mesorhizobium sp.]|nr:MAG: hypothetical protein EOR98_17470 [Mesorhizobium sp.]RWN75456.1 MAG: hypothetical protein EOS02_17095 [Mesorhizobium sp.]RWN77642.1 MAG: hypothetical protein EOS01_18190 [Mesorhizobium sp.]RWN88925.1 MAG: hypothetical protein EOS04_11150 [Mesorhizobium sp.]RWO12943.1 MAG: hypothetical protein EOS15_18025 [Mesorhizobium sp.]